MFKNHLKIAWRNLLKYKVISLVNLFGLTVGLTSCLLILVYVRYDLSFDRYNTNADRIYRLTRDFNNENGAVTLRLATVAPAFAYYFPGEFPEIEKMTSLLDAGSSSFSYKDKLFDEPHPFFADQNLFKIFSIQLTRGSVSLKDPYSIMISEEYARKYFGSEDPINKAMRYENQHDLKVTGVYRSFPSNAHIHPDMLLSFNMLRLPEVFGDSNLRSNWNNNSFLTYLLLPTHYDISKMESRFPAFLDNHLPPDGRRRSKFTSLHLQKLTDIHLYSHQDNEEEVNSDIKRVYIFLSISLFVLLIACINYMNLSTARSSLRAKEIGIRKVIGARKVDLIRQFLSESVVTSYMAMFFAVILLYLLLPWLNKLSGQQLSIRILSGWKIGISLFLIPLVIGLLSGIYPALVMTALQPVKNLKGIIKTGSSVSFQKILVVSQFSISIVLMIVTIIIHQQLNFLSKTSLGYDKDQIVVVRNGYKFGDRFDAFRNDLLSNPDIKDVTHSSRVPTGSLLDDLNAYTFTGSITKQVNTEIKFVSVDGNFIKTYGIRLVAGADFSKRIAIDTLRFILNESAVKAIGWKTAQDAIGKRLKYGNVNGQVIGVVKDFNFESLHQQISPLVLRIAPPERTYLNNISVKIDTKNTAGAMAHLEAVWKKFLPDTPFESYFLNEKYDSLYNAEQKQGSLLTIFSSIAIFIACLGLLGLSIFSISQRKSEIAIRKVLGAKVESITLLLSADVIKLLMIAMIIACPLAWYAISLWLKDFVYHISIQWWIFPVAGFTALLFAMIPVGSLAIKAANMNPVKSLRDQSS